MSRIFRDSSVLNQFGSPSINSNTFANRPAFGQPGRLFVSTDTLAIFRDTGTAWDNLTDNPGNIGTLQEVTTNGNQTTVNIQILARESLFSKTFDTSDIGGDATNMINIGSNVNLSSNVLGINNIYSESFKTITSNITLEDDSFHDNTFLYSAINNNSLNQLLPQIPQQFIEQYITEYNKGNIGSEVVVEYESVEYARNMPMIHQKYYVDELKLTNNTINIKTVKDSFSREEVNALITKAISETNECNNRNVSMLPSKFIEQNL